MEDNHPRDKEHLQMAGQAPSNLPAQESVLGEREFSSLFELSAVGAAVVDPTTGRFLRVNQRLCAITGRSQTELLNTTYHAITHPEDRDRDMSVVAPVLAGDIDDWQSEKRYVRPNGSIVWVQVIGRLIRDNEAKPYRSIAHIVDITDRKRAEAELQESQRHYLDLYERAPDMMASVDAATGNVVHCNQMFCQCLGYSKEEILGRPVFRLYAPESREAAKTLFRQFLESGEVHAGPLKLCRKDGGELYVSLGVSAVRDEQGRIVRSRSVWRDITEQVQTQRSLAETTERLNFVLSATGVGLWFNKLPLSDLNWDERTRELFFVGPDEKPTAELFYSRLHPDDREPTRLAVTKAIQEGSLYEIEHRVVDPRTGEIRWRRSAGMASYGPDGKATRFDGLNYDITEQKKHEEKLRQLAARLSEADRKKDEFLATLAHELRNPLAPIATGLEVMKLGSDDAEQLEEVRNTMERQTKQLVALVDDLLDVSRLSRGKLQLRSCRVGLAEVIQSAVEATRPFIDEANHQLSISLPPQSIFLEADPHRLAQVFSNLLINAAKYTPDKGHISLEASLQDEHVVISVKDTGIGIPSDKLELVFEMFGQIEHPMQRTTAGLGIGLTLVKSLIEMHGGQIEVRSEGPGQGSVFTVRLSVLPQASSTEKPTKAEEPGPATKCRVLVVDDNTSAAKMLGMAVKMLGNEVRVAHDGQEGVETAEAFLPDVIFMDIGMPKMNGFEAAQFIRQHPWGQGMMLVALTGWGQDEDKQRAKEAGFDYHLVKPAEPSELRKLLTQAAKSSQ